jgi:hypothetical protein
VETMSSVAMRGRSFLPAFEVAEGIAPQGLLFFTLLTRIGPAPYSLVSSWRSSEIQGDSYQK